MQKDANQARQDIYDDAQIKGNFRGICDATPNCLSIENNCLHESVLTVARLIFHQRYLSLSGTAGAYNYSVYRPTHRVDGDHKGP